MKNSISHFTSKAAITGIIFAVIILFTNCRTLPSIVKEPAVSYHSTEFKNITLSGVQLLCKVQVQNPNAVDIPFPETDWTLFINTNRFANGTVKNNQKIKANGSALIDVPVNLEYRGLFNTLKSLIGNPQADYKIALGLKIPLPVLGEKVWNIEHEGKLPLPQAPKLSQPSVNVGAVDASKVILNISFNIENPNVFALPAPKISYDYKLNRNSFIKGRLDNQKPLAASSVTPVNFQLQVTYADLFRSIASLINTRNVTSALDISFDFGLSEIGMDILTRTVTGTLPLPGR